jgi:tetratricopeptide (TPR) repeat protein
VALRGGHSRFDEPGWIGRRTFVSMAGVALLAALAAFVWTVETGSPPRDDRGARGVDAGSWDMGFGNRARLLLRRGQYGELVSAARSRLQQSPGDPEALLFAAYALENLAQGPGLGAMEAGAQAGQLYADLLDRVRHGDAAAPVRNPEYYAGWALLNLGRPVMARESFGRFADQYREGGPRADSLYNHACYFAMAGDAEAALTAWRRAVLEGAVDHAWARADPDLELIRTDLRFRAWLDWLALRRDLGTRGGERPASRPGPRGL